MALDVRATAAGCPLSADQVFGPIVARSCRQGWDFTLLFEQSILSIAPISIFLLVVPLRGLWLWSSSVKSTSIFSSYAWKGVRVEPLILLSIKPKL